MYLWTTIYVFMNDPYIFVIVPWYIALQNLWTVPTVCIDERPLYLIAQYHHCKSNQSYMQIPGLVSLWQTCGTRLCSAVLIGGIDRRRNSHHGAVRWLCCAMVANRVRFCSLLVYPHLSENSPPPPRSEVHTQAWCCIGGTALLGRITYVLMNDHLTERSLIYSNTDFMNDPLCIYDQPVIYLWTTSDIFMNGSLYIALLLNLWTAALKKFINDKCIYERPLKYL